MHWCSVTQSHNTSQPLWYPCLSLVSLSQSLRSQTSFLPSPEHPQAVSELVEASPENPPTVLNATFAVSAANQSARPLDQTFTMPAAAAPNEPKTPSPANATFVQPSGGPPKCSGYVHRLGFLLEASCCVFSVGSQTQWGIYLCQPAFKAGCLGISALTLQLGSPCLLEKRHICRQTVSYTVVICCQF